MVFDRDERSIMRPCADIDSTHPWSIVFRA